jgi:hypothetical protein
MNAMGHQVPTLIGVDHRGVAEKINDLVPGYMVMGDKGGSMGRHAHAAAREHAADDGRPDRDGRHVPFGDYRDRDGRHVHAW